MIDPSSLLAKVEGWYDSYYIFIGIGVLAFVILIMIVFLFYLGADFIVKNV